MEENVQKYFKYCLVPLCKSTTIRTPNKIFIRLPLDSKRRTKWLKACHRDIHDISVNSNALHVCEDHFNLEEDMENYMRFKLMGGIKKIKPSVVPHIFDCPPDRKKGSAQPVRVAALKRVKRQLVQEDVASTSTSVQPLKDQNCTNLESSLTTEGLNYEDGNQKKEMLTQGDGSSNLYLPSTPEETTNGVFKIKTEPNLLIKEEPMDINEICDFDVKPVIKKEISSSQTFNNTEQNEGNGYSDSFLGIKIKTEVLENVAVTEDENVDIPLIKTEKVELDDC